MAKKVIWVYLVFTFLYNFTHSFIFAVYSIFLEAHQLDLIKMMLPNITFMISWAILEIPTGSFADLFGRKRSILLGTTITAIAYLLYGLSSSLWLFMTAEMICALGGTFVSGAMDAWAVDTLRKNKYEGTLNKLFQKEAYWKQGSIILGAGAGSWLNEIDVSLPWLVSSLGTLGAVAFGQVFIEENPPKSTDWKDKSVWKILKLIKEAITKVAREGIAYGFRHKPLFYMTGFAALLNMIFQPLNMYWSLIFKNQFHFETSELGFLFACIALSLAFGSYISNQFLRSIKQEKIALVSAQLVTASGIFLASWAASKNLSLFVLGFYIHQIGRGTFEPLKKAYLNDRIHDKNRATILSFEAMIVKIGSAIGLLFGGLIAQNFSISFSWWCSGITLAVVIGIFLKIKNGE